MAIIVGDNQDNVIDGTLADEVILAGGGSDTVNAGGGDDLVVAGSGDDMVDAGDGNDVVLAGSGDDTVNAGDGNDLVLAGSGDDIVDGGEGSDIVFAGRGNDTVIHVEADNLDSENWYFGEKGMDTLRLVVSAETLASDEFQEELAAFQAMIDAGGSAEGYFSTLGVYFSSFEAIEVVSDNLAPQSPVPGPVEPGVVAFENDEGAIFAVFTARDPEGGALTFEVSDDRFEVVPFAIGNIPYSLKLKDGVSLDHETEPDVTVVVTMTDPGGLSTSRTFNLHVHDAAPTAIALDNATVDENAVGAEIGGLTVTDPDGDTTFNISVDDDRFEVVDGVLKLAAGESLDFETEPTVSVAVTAASDSSSFSSITEIFDITVNDVNEAPRVYRPTDAAESLVIGELIPAISILDPELAEQLIQEFGNPRSENAPGTYFGLLVATDYTGNQLAVELSDSRFEPVPITEFIPSDTEFSPELETELAAALGADWSTLYLVKLLVSEVIDYETEPTVSMTATATDASGTTSTTLDFEVEDVNEAPQIVRPTGGTVEYAVIGALIASLPELGLLPVLIDSGLENTPGAAFGFLFASDPDGGVLTVTLSDSRFEAVPIVDLVTPGAEIPPEVESVFSGVYVVKLKDDQMLDHEAEPSVPLTATVTDAGNLTASTSFAVGVDDVNEAPTAIALAGDEILDDTPGAVVGAVTVTDPDGDLIFDYQVSDDRFEVVGGVLKLKDTESLDFGTSPTVSLDVTVTDPGDLPFTQSFVIDVIDVPEVAV